MANLKFKKTIIKVLRKPKLHIEIDHKEKICEILHENPGTYVRGTKLVSHEKISLGKKYIRTGTKATDTVNILSKASDIHRQAYIAYNINVNKRWIDYEYKKAYFTDAIDSVYNNAAEQYYTSCDVDITNNSDVTLYFYQSRWAAISSSIDKRCFAEGHTAYTAVKNEWVVIKPGETRTIQCRCILIDNKTYSVYMFVLQEPVVNQILKLLNWNMDVFKMHSWRQLNTICSNAITRFNINMTTQAPQNGKFTAYRLAIPIASNFVNNGVQSKVNASLMALPEYKYEEQFIENNSYGLLMGIRRRK